MPTQCPACSTVNPEDAFYCYYDGRALSTERAQGPLQVGSLPFPTAFYFPDGQTCANFNQLALACNNRWEEARTLLADGIWPTFFNGIGRLDLAAAARQAANESDRDRGLSDLLQKLPADLDCLRPPKLALESTEENLGQLRPGADRKFALEIVNQGMLLLHGTISANCDWLALGDRTGPQAKLFQTRNFYTIAVYVLGGKLRAGLMPLAAEIVIETNGGTLTVPVRAEVPILPFPKGKYANDVLAGACSPREIALKAKEHPQEAALLFEQAAVKVWYASNGWVYPIEGTQGSGKGAVQQFFEALGLTKPPRLEISPQTLAFGARVGERLTKLVTIRTDEAKPVYAQASSNQDWARIGPIKYRGNMVTVPLEIVVPPRPGEIARAQVTIQGNGKQQFVVPVNVAIDNASGTPETGAPSRTKRAVQPTPMSWPRWMAWFVGGFLVTTLVLIIGAIAIKLAINIMRGMSS
jgi:hypothetical protein